MIAKVVFDLPVEGPFDYLIPTVLETTVVPGMRVKVPLSSRSVLGFVIALAKVPSVVKLKTIKSLVDKSPVFDRKDMDFANLFAGYHGCFLGEALALLTRHRKSFSTRKGLLNPETTLYHCKDGRYQSVLDTLAADANCFILVPDFHALEGLKSAHPSGMRSAMFEAFTKYEKIIVIDEDNPSFKQEQSPMYETRHVLLMAQKVYGFDLVFISQTPSVELWHYVNTKRIAYIQSGESLPKPMVIDLSNYKYLDKGILSVPVRNVLESNIKAKFKTLIFFNRRGTFSVTRCTECGFILKCKRCDSAMSFERATHSFVCRQCHQTQSDAGNCPTCHAPKWKSFGMGIDKVQKEISSLFPTARIASFEAANDALPEVWDVLIATVAVLRYKHTLKFSTTAVIDIDTALNRLDIRSSFKTWGLLSQIACMGQTMFIQTRNLDHPMLKTFTARDDEKFYTDELSVRRELDLSPFYHWVAIVFRSLKEKNAHDSAYDMYNHLKQADQIKVTEVQPDQPAKLRDQYRFRVMVGGAKVIPTIRQIKLSLNASKRISGVITTFNVDP